MTAQPLADRFRQAQALHRAGRLAAAEAGYRQILAIDPRHADSLNYLGILASQSGRNEVAADLVGRAITLRPRIADYHDNLGLVLRALGRLDEAGRCHRKALRLDPHHANAQNHLGALAGQMGRPADAERHYREAVRLDARHVEAHNNLGVALVAQDRPEEALGHFHAALRLDARYVDPYANLAGALRNLGRTAEAEAALRAGLHLAPNASQLRYNMAGLLLLTGRFEAGWPLYEERHHLSAAPSPPAVPRWSGGATGDRVLLLQAEQGAGDTILACRYLPLFPPETRLILEVPPELCRLLNGFGRQYRMVSRGDALPAFDLQCSVMSLPLAFGTILGTIPAATPYLHAVPDDVAVWRRRLEQLPGLRVGLVWAGNPVHAEDQRRSISPDLLAPFGTIAGISFVSLQKGWMGQPPPLRLVDWTGELDDFADTAALIAGLDLVIGVDTAVVHLAGALGKPVWLLNRFDPHWLWLLDRTDSPWYPTLRQFRQTRPGDWTGVITAVGRALVVLNGTGT
ncbi:MAG: tetratricopeptide repeat-containing glycosyltransferase family protein [Aliidongia sp.]